MIRAYFNDKAAIWDETIAEKDDAKLKRMAECLSIEPGYTVLDVGTGTGVFVPFLMKKVGGNGRLFAMDIAEEMLRRARAKNFNGNIEYLHADITSIPLSGGIFNAVVCYSSFPHFKNKLQAIAEMARVLKNGGCLFICHTLSRYVIHSIHTEIPAVENDVIPDAGEMRTMLTVAGFVDIKIDDDSDSYLASAIKL